MKNIKIIKSLSIILAVILITGIVPNKHVNAKSIYFAGEYENGEYTISLSQYSEKSSYKNGEECGTMILNCDGYSVMGGYSHGNIIFDGSSIKKIGKNKYKVVDSGYKGYTCTIKVKKKSISVKFKNPKGAMEAGKNGTYKLKKRFYS